MRIASFIVACLFALPLFAKEAVYADGVLKLDTVQVGADTYVVELLPLPNVTPLTFTLKSASKLAPATAHAAAFAGTTLTVPNVLVNGATRASAKLILTGQNPMKFQLNTYSVLRKVSLATPGETLKQGKAFYVNYTGGVLDTAKVKLRAGSTVVPSGIMDNSIAATLPTAVAGNQVLTLELDGDSFQLPITVEASLPVANPKSYVTSFVGELTLQLQSLGLPAGLLDSSTLNTQLAALSEADAQLVGLMVRENLATLLSELDDLQRSSLAFTDGSPTANECARMLSNFKKANAVVALAYGMAAGGLYAAGTGALTGPIAIVTAISVSAGIIAAELATRYQDELLSYNCRQARNATIGTADPLASEIVLTAALEVYESRAKTIQITELHQFADQTDRSDFLATSTSLKTALLRAKTFLLGIGFSSTNAAVVTLNSLAQQIKTDETLNVSDGAHKYVVRAISDTRVSGSALSTRPGTVTLFFDKKDEDLAEGKSISFTIELYNSTDDISIKLPVKLNGASLLEDLKAAAVGQWTVTTVSSGSSRNMELRSNGTGVYWSLVSVGDSCPNGTITGNRCEYKITWKVIKSGDKYTLEDYGFWHPAYTDPAIVERSGITLPLTGFTVHDPGKPDNIGIRYLKQ